MKYEVVPHVPPVKFAIRDNETGQKVAFVNDDETANRWAGQLNSVGYVDIDGAE